MKNTKIVSMTLSAMVLATLGATSVQAQEVVDQKGETPTEVTIIDNVDPTDPTDPLDPTDPTQKMLTLEKVPAAYNFESKLQNATYNLTADLTDETIEVFNDRSDREWSVKANVADNKLTRSSDSKEFTVDSFQIDGTELAATGAEGIVAKAEATKTAANNTGLIETAVNQVSIGFTDTDKALVVGDKLAGSIQYQLYNTADAK
ncbi:WxL domain-containing protein [Candidatus Enterococcus courvalinii]|uniref:WxL domain-containing protein n=1 Tax=Candidatus Enterococcus courvalinii TaxID=2815329 RepID=A0ABS3HZ59_9ENTE|nr:WxL domain-containing protein [Enterococcus sp. MSG2901]MBO0481748.1 WxL domain-containing protein [Enterococcus sp. MSG2901]